MPAQRRTTERARWCTAGHVSPAQPCRGAPRLACPCPATSPGLSTHEPRPFAHRAREQLGGHPAGSGWAREVGGSCCKPRARAHGEWGGRAVISRPNTRLRRPTLRRALRSHIFLQATSVRWAGNGQHAPLHLLHCRARAFEKTTAHCHPPTTRPLQARAVTAAGAADVDLLRALRRQIPHRQYSGQMSSWFDPNFEFRVIPVSPFPPAARRPLRSSAPPLHVRSAPRLDRWRA